MFNNTELMVFVGAVKRNVIETDRMSESQWNALVASQTAEDGSVNWAGVITFLNALLADVPEIISILQAFGLLAGIATMIATTQFHKKNSVPPHNVKEVKS